PRAKVSRIDRGHRERGGPPSVREPLRQRRGRSLPERARDAGRRRRHRLDPSRGGWGVGEAGGRAVVSDRLPPPEPPRKITPRHPGPKPEHDALDHLTMITPRTTTTHRLRHQRLDPSPRSLAEFS